MEDEHEVYGGEIPEVEGDLDGEDGQAEDGAKADDAAGDDAASKELEEMKKRLKEMEDEAAALREMQAKVEKEMSGGAQDPGALAAQQTREEADARSVFVGNVDYACTPEEVQQHFQSCGTVNRVTILTDKFGQPKGFAYVEFLELEAVNNAILLNESELHARQIKDFRAPSCLKYSMYVQEASMLVRLLSPMLIHILSPLCSTIRPAQVTAKRTNLPGLKASRGRRPAMYSPYGYRPRRPGDFLGSGGQCDTALTIDSGSRLLRLLPLLRS
eukprot:SM000109S14173  [mRNA]  locus=s109:410873:412861:- [translate_table: standard]